ncbi:hypothetical protein HYW73_01965 [Candidatus Nomurabacteria bacterium]|nr:hypothetical protein [Candidatus Nomurabacteria bacterium]
MDEKPKFEPSKASDNFFLDKNVAPGKSKDPISDFEAEFAEERVMVEALKDGRCYEEPYLDQNGKLRIRVKSRKNENIIYDDSIEGFMRVTMDAGILLSAENIARYQSFARKELDN